MKVIKPATRWEFLKISELWEYRELFWLLLLRDVKLKYKQTALGVLWVVLQPLAAALLFTLLFSYLTPTFLPQKIPYLLFAFTGMLVWLIFSQIVQRASTSLLGDAKLISKVYFPRILIPLASSTAVLIDFLIALGVLFVLLLFYSVPITWNALLFFPLLVSEMLFAIGLASFLAAWNVHYRDFIHVIPFFLQLLMYASALFYPFSLIPEKWQFFFALNPLVGFVEGFRYVFLGCGPFPTMHLTFSVSASLCMFFCGLLIFQRLERTFADVI